MTKDISIHAPRGGSDRFTLILFFLWVISIHAPRGGSDTRSVMTGLMKLYFNPRSPRGERRKWDGTFREIPQFQSTLPAGGATIDCIDYYVHSRFQSTLPAGGATNGRA